MQYASHTVVCLVFAEVAHVLLLGPVHWAHLATMPGCCALEDALEEGNNTARAKVP